MNLILASIGVFLVVVLLLVVILLVAKNFLVPSGNVKLTINGEKELEVASGSTLLNTLSVNGIFLSSACGGKGSCGQCKCQVVEGGGEILPSEIPHFSRKQVQDHWRLGCQVKVKGDMGIKIDESVLGVKEWECEVISNKNVATFIKEFIVALPKGEHMDFIPGSYAQIKIPKFSMDYDKDIDKSLIGEEYLPAWEKFGLLGLKCRNDEETIRAYSMANYPAEGDRIMLTVRIATPPFKPKDQGPGFMDVMPGIASSYIFTLKPGDKVTMSGPYGDFHPIFDSKKEMMWIGGGAGMAPLRAQIMHLTKTLQPCDELLLRRACPQRGVLPGRLPADRKGFPQLQVPPCTGPSRPGSRCSGREVHSGIRTQRNLRDLPERPRSSRRYRILHVRSRPDVQSR